ncbi:DUF1631 family protein [Denitromonas iodatirespirans]|uniref:DUF1631 family protein n=1 Tax=Denitromonas iodatirespirans TaxID=2795389 RepID=A0A944DPA2_DENI1|nr:DUF1631 family protein [Denitromonas iodatirespirans]MBT0962194.1 DUF1631 family protein [Denitromonas iodatirespirans]
MSTIATSAVADCRRHLLNMLDTVLRELGFRDDAWVAHALDAAGQRYDELTGVRDRRGFDAVRSLTASRISLIHEDDLAYTIDLSDLARRLREACAPSLVRVHLRLLTVLGQSDLEPEMSPLAPETACEALRALADAADLSAEARERLLVRAEQPLRQALTGLYATLDTLLAAAGVTPPPPRPSTAATPPRRTGGSNDGGGLGSLRHSLAGPTATPTASAPAVDPRRLAEAIERLEARLVGTTPGDAHELRLGLREIAGLLTPDRALAIEIVDALFQVIADDTAVPPDLRQHLAALHTPTLRRALRHPDLLDDSDSPLLKLLESTLRLGCALPANRHGTLLPRIGAALDELAAAPDLDDAQCGRAQATIDLMQAELTNLFAEQLARYAAAAARAERKEIALQSASNAINAMMLAETHPVLLTLLERYWVQALAQAAQHRDRDDRLWRARLDTANRLIHSAPSQTDPATRASLLKSLPALVGELRSGLTQLGLDEDTITRALAPCMELHSAVMRGATLPKIRHTPTHRPAALRTTPEGLLLLQHHGHVGRTPGLPAAWSACTEGDRIALSLPDGSIFEGVLAGRTPLGQMRLLLAPADGHVLAVSLRALATANQLTLGRPNLSRRAAEHLRASRAGAA